jgi:hypothetical protein
LTQKKNLKRRRCILADVMGDYTLKARAFNRIRLFVYSCNVINKAAGKYDKDKKRIYEGMARLREFERFGWLRVHFHRWWNQCVEMHNNEIATRHRFISYTWKILIKWQYWAHKEVHDRRMELVVMENQLRLQRMMETADEEVKELLELEKLKAERDQAKLDAVEKSKKQAKLEKSKQFVQEEKDKDHRYTLKVQRNKRRQRVRKQMKLLKKQFNRKWNKKVCI